MQGGFETRPYKIARRVIVCRPTPCVALWQQTRARRSLAHRIAHATLMIVGAGFKPARHPQSRRMMGAAAAVRPTQDQAAPRSIAVNIVLSGLGARAGRRPRCLLGG